MNQEPQLPYLREAFYPRDRRSIPRARLFGRQALTDWQVAGRADDILLCISELATNALLHGVPPGRGFRLHLYRHADAVRIELHDSGPGVDAVCVPPCLRPEREVEDGRGLLLVSTLADKWGVSPRDPGKIVWCEFTI
ncbi:ATP-binding protein [Streptomyces sp. NPDC020681]|uniref:ATP-binding protein n=1 Tax=Streptomyces sp. NPDC020681 TaxID=3365083 RepID=UPI0037898F13